MHGKHWEERRGGLYNVHVKVECKHNKVLKSLCFFSVLHQDGVFSLSLIIGQKLADTFYRLKSGTYKTTMYLLLNKPRDNAILL